MGQLHALDGGAMRVLIADRSASVRERISRMFAPVDGAEIVGLAKNWTDCLETMSNALPDVVILDIQLIRWKNINDLTECKQQNAEMTIIVLTDLTAFPYRTLCLKAGVDFYLDRSTGIEKLRNVIQGLNQRSGTKG